MPELEPAAVTPIWRQIADALSAGIADGTWPPGSAIPSETDLSRQYGIARGTARKAVKSLVDRGLVTAVQGKGSYVNQRVGSAGAHLVDEAEDDVQVRNLPDTRLPPGA